MTQLNADVSFASTRAYAGDTSLSGAGKPFSPGALSRRDFVHRLCQGAGASFLPAGLWKFPSSGFPEFIAPGNGSPATAEFFLRPAYRTERPLDAVLLKVQSGRDRFVNEKYADDVAKVLAEWSAALLRSPQDIQVLAKSFATDFTGASLQAVDSRVVRSSSWLEVRETKFGGEIKLNKEAFTREWCDVFGAFSKIEIAEFQVTRIDSEGSTEPNVHPPSVQTQVRYEVAGSVPGFHRQQRIGHWQMDWESESGQLRLRNMKVLDETLATSASPFFVDISGAALGANSSYATQMLHGTDYWRTVLDGACGIDVYGHNGVSVADFDGDGRDDLYVCQPAGLPNRLYRNRGDGTFEDVTEASGLGLLDNTSCALFADFGNKGKQDVVLVRANGPLLFLNEGGGKFSPKPDAFQFSNPPQGTFTGAAVADYDRDGWLDIYFCLYSYYQGTGQYRYPSPYYDAENGPPNFLMRNNRDDTFRDVTKASGLDQNNRRYSFCCAWNDYNRDGWPDLYVVNDFGRKNLYRNNGNGTFTDVAGEAKAEDIGAGMSVSWLDYDNDGADDLYVANMWTAAGVRLSMQDTFKKDSAPDVRALYQKHAMGNSLLRNRGSSFDDTTNSSQTGMGRWAWSSDAFDFDHDGFQDLYIANGMVSGPSRDDLNSFFWRQVVANSPDQAAASHEYEEGWNAINELIRADGTWSGYERNICYANNRDGTFSDVSYVVGLDFIEDSRSFALADFDNDGRLEVFLKNRNAPQLRILKNVAKDLPPSVAFRLQGTKSNRDAVGGSISIDNGKIRQTRSVQIGLGFLSQHSKDVFFVPGETTGRVHAQIRWPSGLIQELRDIPVNHRVWVEEGREPVRLEPFTTAKVPPVAADSQAAESNPSRVETWLLSPVPAPVFTLPDLSGQNHALSDLRAKPTLLHFWTASSEDCIADLKVFQERYARWSSQGLQLLTINVDPFAAASDSNESFREEDLAAFVQKERLSFPILRGSADVAAIYNLLYRQLFDRHRDLGLPTSFLIDAGQIVKVYRGSIVPEHVEQDFRNIPKSDGERLARGLPFSAARSSISIGRNHLSLGTLFFQRGYLDQAESSFEQASRDDSFSAEALYGIGSVYLNQNKNSAAREMFERCLKAQASYPNTMPDAWNNLGVLATRVNHVSEAIDDFQEALKLNPNHLLSLNNLGNAYRLQKKWDDARNVFVRALAIAPDDPESNYGLGMVYAQTDETAKAYQYLQSALKVRPDYPEALNNLGVLYLMTQRPDDAVATFEQCIRVAPTFDQAYMNLARIYALRGTRDKARNLLGDLLKQHPDHPQAKQMLEQLQQ